MTHFNRVRIINTEQAKCGLCESLRLCGYFCDDLQIPVCTDCAPYLRTSETHLKQIGCVPPKVTP